jgi:hypothetical protein
LRERFYTVYMHTQNIIAGNQWTKKMGLIEGNAKCCHLKNLPVKGLCGRCLSVWGAEPHAPLPTVYVYTVYLFTRGGGESWTREKVRGATVHKAGSKMSTWLTVLQSKNSDKHMPQRPFTGHFFRWRQFALVSILYS